MTALAIVYLVLFAAHSAAAVQGKPTTPALGVVGLLMVLTGAGLAVAVIA